MLDPLQCRTRTNKSMSDITVNEKAANTDQQLCSICQDANIEDQFEDHGTISQDLGHIHKIFEKHYCSFCRLVTQLFKKRWIQGGYAETKTQANTDINYIGHVILTNNDSRMAGSSKYLILRVPLGIAPYGAGPDEILVGTIFVAAPDASQIGRETGHNGRILQDYVDVSLVRSWLHDCNEMHGAACTPSRLHTKSLPENFRVIDVQDGKLILAPNECRYFSLSYVWGQASMMKATKANYVNLTIKGALSYPLHPEIPLVIRNAMQFVAALSEKYLWVDSLCIIQDDPEDKDDQISRMDDVYSGAYATIIAVASKDAQEGIPGIDKECRREQQVVERVGSLRLLVPSPPLDTVLEESIWNTRAWTYQERLLSRRRIYLSREQAYFECQGSIILCEDSEGHGSRVTGRIDNIHSKSGTDSYLHSNSTMAFNEFCQYVEEYSARQLSYHSDILNAFTGIVRLWEDAFGWEFTNGLPKSMLSFALLWESVGLAYRRILVSGDGRTFLPFPSWSWAGWMGEVFYEKIMDGNFRSEIEAYEVKKAIGSGIADLKMHSQLLCSDVLEFYSSSAKFLVSSCMGILFAGRDVGDLRNKLGMCIYDNKERQCGVAFGIDPRCVEDQERVLYEFVLLSRVRLDDGQNCKQVEIRSRKDALKFLAMLPSDNDWPPPLTAGAFDYHVFESRPWCLLNVMLIKRDSGFAERVAIGRVHEDAWIEGCPEKKLFRLI